MHIKRIHKLRQKMEHTNIEAYFTYHKLNREYLSNFTGTSGYVLVTQADAVLFTDSRYTTQASMEAREFKVIEHDNPYYKTLNEWLAKHDITSLAVEATNVTLAEFQALDNQLDAKVVPVNDLIAELRIIKDSSELAIIQRAVDICDEAFSYLLTIIKPGVTERAIALELEFFLKKRGASHLAFDTIVASGYRSALPHGIASDKEVQVGDFVTIDFGAMVDGYCSDITRTVVAGKANPKQKEIYNTVLTAQQLVIDNIKAGMKGKQADEIARQYIYQKGYEGYFGHGLGHGIGKEVHEAPRLSPISETVLTSGMVVTVEPGIYISDVGGVRIEDDVVIEAQGCRILNKSPKELIEL